MSPSIEEAIDRLDFLAMSELGAQEGVIETQEHKIIANLLRFDRVRVKDVMTPRTVVVKASGSDTIQSFYAANENLRFSRIPLFQGDSQDHVTGYFLKDELLASLLAGEGERPLAELEREILVVHETAPIPELFQRFLEKGEHIALVVDDFGGMSGIATMEDVIETLLGTEIVDEMDSDHDMQALARRNWERRAKAMGLVGAGGQLSLPIDKAAGSGEQTK